MKKSIVSVYSDSRKHDPSKLQPLFQKKFETTNFRQIRRNQNSDAENKVKHEERQKKLSLLSAGRDSSDEKKPTQEYNFSSEINRQTPSGDQNLQITLNKLRSEKLELYKDLSTYEDRFYNKLCMRARLKAMRDLCGSLKIMVYKAKDRIDGEVNLYDRVSDGLDRLKTNVMNFDPEAVRQHVIANLDEEEEMPKTR